LLKVPVSKSILGGQTWARELPRIKKSPVSNRRYRFVKNIPDGKVCNLEVCSKVTENRTVKKEREGAGTL
jgi:hypothetical protein